MLVLTLQIWPYEGRLMNGMQLFNESCLSVSGYHLLVLMNPLELQNDSSDSEIGYSLIFLTLLNILGNLAYILYTSYVDLRPKLVKLMQYIKLKCRKMRKTPALYNIE
jgi:hypothetical protein